MSPRKQVIKASRAFPSAGDGDCVEVDDTDEEMFPEELPQSSMSSSRRRERVVKAKPKEMTEEEMMDLALRLSEQEASIAAAKRQQEDEAMTEALKESMFSQTQPCASPLSQRYHGNTDLSPKLPSRRKLAYPAAAAACCGDVVLVDEPAATESSVEPDPRGAGNHKHNKRKRKREDGVALPERPDLPETQKICSQSSALENPCSQTDPCQLPKTFKPSSPASKLHVHLSRLSPETLKTCTTSGFILCSQQSLTSTPTSLPSPSKSPTFPGSATHSDNVGHSKKPTFPKSTDYCSDPDVEEIGETNPRFHCPKSPVFGRVESTKASYNTNTKSPVFGRVESTRASDDTGIAPKSPVFGRVVSTRASDYETQIAASDTSQKSLATCDDDASPPEGLKSSKLSRSKRQMHSASHTASKGLMFPKCPASTGKERPGDAKDMWRDGCSVKTQDCRTSPPFGKGRQVSAETSPDSGEESPRFCKTSLPKTGSGLSSPGLGGTSPVFGRTSPVFGRTSPVFGSTRTEKSSILPATIGQESSSQDSHSASSRPASAISNKESRQPPQCLQKTNGLNHRDGESESTSGDPVSKPATAALAGKKKCPKSDEESIPETMKMTSDMTSRWSDNKEDSEQSEVPPSPVFPEERRLQPAADPKRSPEQAGSALPAPASPSPKRMRSSPVPAAPRAVVTAGSDPSPTCRPRVPWSGPGPSQEPPGRAPSLPAGPRGEPLVHYYWGVPFCPQGLDPDGYTQVILAQMEVYEKSLKSAQRDLLRKAEWGDAITPQAEEPLEDSPELIPTISLGRPGLRSRRRASGVKLSREEEEEEDEGSQAEEAEREAGEPAEEGEEDLDVVGCDVCPETQLSGELTPDPGTGEAAGPAETQPDSPSLLQSLPRSRGEEAKEEEEEEEEEETHTPDLNKKEEEGEAGEGGASEQLAVMSPSREQAPQSGQQQQQEEEEEETETQGAVGAEERKEAGAAAASSVDCPICQGAFPASEIEMHAAFCDGDQEVVECPPEEDSPVSHRPSKRRALKSLATEERGDPSGHAPASRGREKCYVCHKSFPSAEYARHTESCLQRAGPAAAAPPKGDLLAALETTERRHPGGPSLSRPPGAPRDVIDLSHNEEEEEEEDDDEGEDEEGGGGGQPATFRVSDSPIRAFKSISEASDSLVDFRRQNAPREPGQRARGRRGAAGGAGGGGGGRGGGLKRKFKRR